MKADERNMSESSFTVLREIGVLTLDDKSEIHFSIDVYRNFRYVSIRRYIDMDGLNAPTHDGVTLTPPIVRALTAKIAALSDEPHNIPPDSLGKFAKRPGICIVAGFGMLKGVRGLVLRQWEDEKGWTKKGVWLPLKKIKEIKKLFQETKAALDEQPEDDF